eukprot:12388657-Alexandrium_andersonii.AAC.1
MPTPAEVRVTMRHASRRGQLHFSLLADVRKAHRRCLNLEEDWGLQACWLKPPFFWVNRVGAFGVSTACNWWSRLAGVLSRLGWAL